MENPIDQLQPLPEGPTYNKDMVIRMWSDYIDILRKNNKAISRIQAVTAKEYARIYIQQGYAVMVLQGASNTLELYVAATKQVKYEFIAIQRSDLKYTFKQDGDYILEEITHKEN